MKHLQRWLSGFTVASIVCGSLMYRYRKRITAQTANAHQGVSIIIPARNEAKNLPRLLASLTEAENTEVIVMDDGSTDATRDIAEGYGAKVYAVLDDVEWQGKSHACYEGSLKAQKALFMFVDADVWFEAEDSLKRILAQYQQQGNQGLLSIQPYHYIEAPYENFSVIFNLMTVIGMNVFSVTREKNTPESAFGPVLLTNRADYFRTQGHRNAATQIIEGFALSEAYHQANLPVRLFEGEGTVNFRMYPQGMRSLIAGWSKHFAVGAQNTQSSVMLLIMAWLFGSAASLAQVIAALSKPKARTQSQTLRALSLYTLYGLQFYRLGRRTGSFKSWLILAHPMCFAFFIFIFSKSWFDVNIRKSVRWKGRNITIKK
ncbi:glycosyltransferase family 2 protein [Staphylococcus debuckii]|uniref:glycosyltransferase family 2 protein n=1 Tax=Staphylococcus debuckii TaxID=2044912 RepID=UPI001F0CCEC0|nr:glycosyltransferase family A protein [Staphylococcus debuckii]